MSGLDNDRFRNQTVSFRVSPAERQALDARIRISGMPKGKFIIQSVLNGRVEISVGKYQSDRLSLELRRLREQMSKAEIAHSDPQQAGTLEECRTLLTELIRITGQHQHPIAAKDFEPVMTDADSGQK